MPQSAPSASRRAPMSTLAGHRQRRQDARVAPVGEDPVPDHQRHEPDRRHRQGDEEETKDEQRLHHRRGTVVDSARLVWANLMGRISPGAARNARLQMTTCACGMPGGSRSLSKNLAKNVRASRCVRVRASSPRRDRSPLDRCRSRSPVAGRPARASQAPSARAGGTPSRARRRGRR